MLLLREGPTIVYVFRRGQLGDSLVALPAIRAIKRAIGDTPLVLITDSVPGAVYVPSWEVFRLTGWFAGSLRYTALNRSRFAAVLQIVGMSGRIRRLGKGPMFYLVNNGVPVSMVMRHRFFFERICGTELIGTKTALEPYVVRDSEGYLQETLPEHQRLLHIVGEYFPDAVDDLGAHQHSPAAREMPFVDLPDVATDHSVRMAAVGPGSKMPCKRWPMERFVEVCRYLSTERGIQPVMFGGPEDKAVGDLLVDACNGRALNLCGVSIGEAAAAMQQCAFYIGNDTGTMHLAATVGLRCIGIFSGRDAPGRWHPVGERHIILRTRLKCEGCMATICPHGHNHCLTNIAASDVIEAVDTMAAARSRAAG